MGKTGEYIVIGIAVLGGGFILYKIFVPATPVVNYNATPIQNNNSPTFTDVLSSIIRGAVAGIGDSSRSNPGEGMSPTPSRPTSRGTTGPIIFGDPSTYGGQPGYRT